MGKNIYIIFPRKSYKYVYIIFKYIITSVCPYVPTLACVNTPEMQF